MNGTDTTLNAELTAAASPPQFPSWPVPSGGAPFPGSELGPIQNPYPYGSPQGANISTAPPAPLFKATFFPTKMPPLNGQNQPQQLPAWPAARFNVQPTLAPPSISAISPPPIMGPGPQGTQPYEMGPLAGTPAPGRTFPAGSFLDGYGNVISPTVVQTIGGGP